MQHLAKPNRSNFLRNTGLTALLAAGLAMSGQVNAASKCKGLESSVCGDTASCSWVQTYERKDGRKVNGFCRTSAKRAAQKAPQAKKATTTKK